MREVPWPGIRALVASGAVFAVVSGLLIVDLYSRFETGVPWFDGQVEGALRDIDPDVRFAILQLRHPADVSVSGIVALGGAIACYRLGSLRNALLMTSVVVLDLLVRAMK